MAQKVALIRFRVKNNVHCVSVRHIIHFTCLQTNICIKQTIGALSPIQHLCHFWSQVHSHRMYYCIFNQNPLRHFTLYLCSINLHLKTSPRPYKNHPHSGCCFLSYIKEEQTFQYNLLIKMPKFDYQLSKQRLENSYAFNTVIWLFYTFD